MPRPRPGVLSFFRAARRVGDPGLKPFLTEESYALLSFSQARRAHFLRGQERLGDVWAAGRQWRNRISVSSPPAALPSGNLTWWSCRGMISKGRPSPNTPYQDSPRTWSINKPGGECPGAYCPVLAFKASMAGRRSGCSYGGHQRPGASRNSRCACGHMQLKEAARNSAADIL